MRLTLRTMLAYMDDVLEPADAQELGRKIQESEFASGLVHRIRSCMRRIRLGAPRPEGKGMGLDPNTVAEYLDSTLPQDRVPDFEKVCLESDAHLAEVAACHQILTLVLGEPADVDPAMRQRMYRISEQPSQLAPPPEMAGPPVGAAALEAARQARDVDVPPPESDVERGEPSSAAAPVAGESLPGGSMTDKSAVNTSDLDQPPVGVAEPPVTTPVEPVEPAPAVRPHVGKRQQVVPEYLRSSRETRKWPLAVAAAAAFLAAVVVLRLMGPLDSSHPLISGFGEEAEVAQADGVEHEPAADAAGSRRSAPADASADRAAAGDESNSEGVADEQVVDEQAVGEDRAGEGATGEEPGADELSDQPGESTARRSSPAGPGGIDAETAGVDDDSLPAPATPPSIKPPPATAVGSPSDDAADADSAASPNIRSTSPPSGRPPTADGAAGGPVSVGRFISEGQVLARQDAQTSFWNRLAPRTALAAGDRLLVLPTFRPQLVLTSGVQFTFAGATAFELLPPTMPEAPGVAVQYGRMLVIPVGRADKPVQLNLAGRRGHLSFADLDSAAALVVGLYLPPGANPEQTQPVSVARIFATSGALTWQDETVPAETAIPAGQVCSLLNSQPAQIADAGAMPEWIEPVSLSGLDRMGSDELVTMLKRDRPLGLSLKEGANHRRYEVRHLAVRCLAYMNDFEPCVEALEDPSHRSSWNQLFEALQAALARGPETAQRVRVALEKLRSQEATAMYRLLWGYSPEQLAGGAAEQLVGYLDHEQLGVRVLAFENLRRITGKTQLYSPEHTAERRKRPIQAWRDRLKEGAIVYQSAPSPWSDDAAP